MVLFHAKLILPLELKTSGMGKGYSNKDIYIGMNSCSAHWFDF